MRNTKQVSFSRIKYTAKELEDKLDVLDGIRERVEELEDPSIMITFTMDNDILTADKTFAEVYQAYQKGFDLQGSYENRFYSLSTVTESRISLISQSVYNDIIYSYTILFNADGSCEADVAQLSEPEEMLPLTNMELAELLG